MNRLLPLAFCLALGLGGGTASAQLSREYDIKAAFLYNFVSYVHWPAESPAQSNTTVNVCVLGNDPFGRSLDALKDKVVRGKKLAILLIHEIPEALSCNLLFISASEARRLNEIVTALGNANTLTVSDMERFTENGGVIHLVNDRNKVVFEINAVAAERAHLTIDSRLLNLARAVTRGEARTSPSF